MTGLEIKRLAENYTDEPMDDPDALNAINRALTLIGDMALIYEETVIHATEDRVWYELPANITNVREVERADDRSWYYGFRVRDRLISFDDVGSYRVYYRRLPNLISNINQTPEVHPAYHQCLATYVIAWWKLKDDDENPDGLRHMQLFDEHTLRVFNSLRRVRGSRQVAVQR